MIEWKVFSVILAAIILIGSVADMLVINEEWEIFKRKLFNLSSKVKNSSFNSLMFLLANKVVYFLESTVKFTYKSNLKSTQWFSLKLTWFVLFVVSFSSLFIVFFRYNYLSSIILIVPLLAVSLIWFFVIIFYEFSTGKWNDNNDELWRIYSKTAFFSALITFVAILLGSELFNVFGISEYWFYHSDTQIDGVIKHRELLGLLNYPFDFLSLVFTYICVKRIANKKNYYMFFPLLDITFSFALSCMLYIVLNSISQNALVYPSLVHDINNLIVDGPEKSQFDLIYLLPIILSTFLPITILALVFVFLNFYKYVSLLFARVLHVLSEKQGSIFKEIAFTLSAFLALVNSLAAL